ncbi:MAG: M23 family metallopeptidase [Myxococcales bacterium]|nr:M23 family metallopeptidase [Myxococcales bacterium]
MGRDGITIMLLRGGARPALTLRLPSLLARLLPLGAALLLTLPGWVGWLAQAQLGLDGAHTQQLTGRGIMQRLPLPDFQILAPIRSRQTAAQLKRRGALLHAMKLGLGSRRAASLLLAGTLPPEWIAAADKQRDRDGTLDWPVPQGWFVRGYGSGLDGYHLAVDIMGERGSPVHAAAPGLVGYAGDGVRGYGNMVLLLHPGGRVTLYAHNETNLVVAGQRVKRGEQIATLGNTGISRGPHVHFELVHDGRNCDPLALFRPGVRHRPGHLGEIDKVRWRPESDRPRSVRCARRRRHPNSRYFEHRDDDLMEQGEPLAATQGTETAL